MSAKGPNWWRHFLNKVGYVFFIMIMNLVIIIIFEMLISIHYLEERVKVPWPVSDREALLHYFEIEYFKEDLIFVLLNTLNIDSWF